MKAVWSRIRSAIFALAVIVISLVVTNRLPRPESTTSEVARLRQHFAQVDVELGARDVSHLSEKQRAARIRNITRLREYARTGLFPHNHNFADMRVPYFRDQHGTLCAMAYLVAASGHTKLVERVVRTNNNAYLPELARDPELLAWLDENGLSVAEAARIQPEYNWDPVADDAAPYNRAAIAAAVVSGGVVTWTLFTDPKRGGYLPGITSIGVGALDLLLAFGGAVSDVQGGMPAATAVVGGLTTAAGIVYTMRVLSARSRPKETSPTGPASQSQSWQPLIYNADGRARLGVQIRW